MNRLIVTIDGPAGSGKSTIARKIAAKIDAAFLDTGAMYRAVTLAALRKGISLENGNAVLEILNEHEFKFEAEDDIMRVWIDEEEVSEEIRKPEVTEAVKFIANNEKIREMLVELQRKFAEKEVKIVTEGRDQGTVAFPDADKKFFLNASIEERANRRYEELKGKNIEADYEKILEAIRERDSKDESRKVGPLKKAEDAVEIDTSDMSIQEVTETILEYLNTDEK